MSMLVLGAGFAPFILQSGELREPLQGASRLTSTLGRQCHRRRQSVVYSTPRMWTRDCEPECEWDGIAISRIRTRMEVFQTLVGLRRYAKEGRNFGLSVDDIGMRRTLRPAKPDGGETEPSKYSLVCVWLCHFLFIIPVQRKSFEFGRWGKVVGIACRFIDRLFCSRPLVGCAQDLFLYIGQGEHAMKSESWALHCGDIGRGGGQVE